jgi:hypothetical protein
MSMIKLHDTVISLSTQLDSCQSYFKPIFDSSMNFLTDSTLINNDSEVFFLLGLLHERYISSSLLYRGSRDGFKCYDFHAKCDNQGPTLTIFKNEKDRRFGGFTMQSWDSSGYGRQDSKAFLFSLDLQKFYPIMQGQ